MPRFINRATIDCFAPLAMTYGHADFEKACRFYEASGFYEAGRIADYLPDVAAMIVYAKCIG